MWARSFGSLRADYGVPDLTPGVCVVHQVANRKGDALVFTVESIKLNEVGRGK